jgi:hypothetical protein
MDSYTQFYTDNMKQSLLNDEDRANLNSLIATDRNVKTALRNYLSLKDIPPQYKDCGIATDIMRRP